MHRAWLTALRPVDIAHVHRELVCVNDAPTHTVPISHPLPSRDPRRSRFLSISRRQKHSSGEAQDREASKLSRLVLISAKGSSFKSRSHSYLNVGDAFPSSVQALPDWIFAPCKVKLLRWNFVRREDVILNPTLGYTSEVVLRCGSLFLLARKVPGPTVDTSVRS
jgi:hypothetical protein